MGPMYGEYLYSCRDVPRRSLKSLGMFIIKRLILYRYTGLWLFAGGPKPLKTGQFEVGALKPGVTNRSFIKFMWAHLGLAVSYSELGRGEEARAEIAEVLKIHPQFSLEGMRQRWPYKDPTDLERSLAALRKAGLK